mgnify:CR=1 FL=1
MDFTELKDFLDSKVIEYNNTQFIESDPISIPHSFDKKEDIEISALLVATIAWGQRKTIINNGNKMMELMDNSPHDFILNHSDQELKSLSSFKHRTFNGDDFMFFIAQLKRIYQNYGNLEKVFQQGLKPNSINCLPAIENFRNTFFYQISEENRRTMKHVSSPEKGSAAKRLIMFLRWMVRDSSTGVDFGIWKSISPSLLSCPLDVHSGNVARKLGVLNRTQNDWKAVIEMDETLRKMDPDDPAKYDFALFGLGVFEKF